MPNTQKLSGHFGPLFFIATIVVLVIWLSSGSSNKPRQADWVAGWKPVNSFELPRRAPAAVAHNGYLYVVGGIDGNERYVHAVEYAPVKKDGTLGAWRRTSPIIEGRFYNAAVAFNDYLYTLGGGSGAPGELNYPIASVERARIKADGSLGPWQTISQLLTPRRGLKTVLHNNNLYAIGGYDGRFLKSIEQAEIQADGRLGNWQMEQHESIIDRYIHSAAANGDTVYLLGGHMRNPEASYSDVESSRIQANTRLTPWQIETHGLLTPRLVAEAFSLGTYLYIAGGHTGNQRLTSVEVARIKANGSLETWRNTSPLPVQRSAFAAATYQNYIYVLGGGGEGQPLNNVHMASANLQGELGYASISDLFAPFGVSHYRNQPV